MPYFCALKGYIFNLLPKRRKEAERKGHDMRICSFDVITQNFSSCGLGPAMLTSFGLWVPGYAVSGGSGVLALQVVDSSPPSGPEGARGRLVLAELIHAGLPGHVEPHGLLVVAVNTLSGWHITLAERKETDSLLFPNHFKKMFFIIYKDH